MDKYTIKIVDNMYHLIMESNENGVHSRKSTNNIDDINEVANYIHQYLADKEITYLSSKEIVFADKFKVVLEDYDKYKASDLYKVIYSCVDEKTQKINYKLKTVDFNLLKHVLKVGVLATFVGIAVVKGVKSNDIVDNALKPGNHTIKTNNNEIQSENIANLINSDLDLPYQSDCFDRLSDSRLRRISMHPNSSVIPINLKLDDYNTNYIYNFFQTNTWDYIQKYSYEYGVDPYLLLAIGFKESSLSHENTIPGGKFYNGHGVGIMQHEDPQNERIITAYNYVTDKEDIEKMNMENACNIEMNIKMAAMMLQNRLQKYNNNIYITIQSYNYGDYAMDIILENYAKETNCNVFDIINNDSNLGWLKYVEDLHNNPKKYIANWQYDTYGDSKYIEGVLGCYIGHQSLNLGVLTDLVTLEKRNMASKVDKKNI